MLLQLAEVGSPEYSPGRPRVGRAIEAASHCLPAELQAPCCHVAERPLQDGAQGSSPKPAGRRGAANHAK
eukprot:4405199-Alexandrium_andersonii.AAC.1